MLNYCVECAGAVGGQERQCCSPHDMLLPTDVAYVVVVMVVMVVVECAKESLMGLSCLHLVDPSALRE